MLLLQAKVSKTGEFAQRGEEFRTCVAIGALILTVDTQRYDRMQGLGGIFGELNPEISNRLLHAEPEQCLDVVSRPYKRCFAQRDMCGERYRDAGQRHRKSVRQRLSQNLSP